MSNKNKDLLGINQPPKEKGGRKRSFKQLIKVSQEERDDNNDPYKCKKRPWSEEEDQLVIKLVQEHGPQKWTFIATHLEGRIGKQCRERWHNHLNPNIKKYSWSEEEEWVLFLFHRGIGNKWAEIAKYILGRTDNSIKNHWNSGMKKRLEDYSRKLANVREIFSKLGESYFNRITVAGEKKALEILLLNKQYVPSDNEDDSDDEEEEGQEKSEEQQEQNDEQENIIEKQQQQELTKPTINDNNNLDCETNPMKNSKNNKSELLDCSQKTKEKTSVNSKIQINPFTWSDDKVDKNASTLKKSAAMPKLIKHSTSLQYPLNNTCQQSQKENICPQTSSYTPKGNTSSASLYDNASHSTILKENKSKMNALLPPIQKRLALHDTTPSQSSFKEEPQKKLKLDESSPTNVVVEEKKRKQMNKKDTQESSNQNVTTKTGKRKNQSLTEQLSNEGKKETKSNSDDISKTKKNDSSQNSQQLQQYPIDEQMYQSQQNSTIIPPTVDDDKLQYNRSIYENNYYQSHQFQSAYYPYPIPNGSQPQHQPQQPLQQQPQQLYPQYPHHHQTHLAHPSQQQQQQYYPSTYMGAQHPHVSQPTAANVAGANAKVQSHPPYNPHQVDPQSQYGQQQQYKFDKRYYPYYGPINYMYHPIQNGPTTQSYQTQTYPYYHDYYGQKVAGQQQLLNYPQQNQMSMINSTQQQQYIPQEYPINKQYPQHHDKLQQQQPQLNQNKQLSQKTEQNQNNTRYDSKQESTFEEKDKQQQQQSSSIDSDILVSETRKYQRKSSILESTATNKEYLEMQFSEEQQQSHYKSHHYPSNNNNNNTNNNMNPYYKYDTAESSPYQILRNSPNTHNQSDEQQSQLQQQTNNHKSKLLNDPLLFSSAVKTNVNANTIQNNNVIANYESPSKMLNLSERVMLKTVSSTKFNLNHLNSNLKIPLQRQALHPLNLNTLFNQEEDYFNETVNTNNNN